MSKGGVDATDLLKLDASRFGEDEFVARHPSAFLSFDAPEDDEDPHFMTELANAPATKKSVVVTAIVKRDKSLFQDRISVGRARNSDIVIRHASVSKLHAHFRTEATGLTLTDVGSHNGTKVGGVALVPHRPEAVRPGMTVVIGAIHVRVLEAKNVYELLRR